MKITNEKKKDESQASVFLGKVSVINAVSYPEPFATCLLGDLPPANQLLTHSGIYYELNLEGTKISKEHKMQDVCVCLCVIKS